MVIDLHVIAEGLVDNKHEMDIGEWSEGRMSQLMASNRWTTTNRSVVLSVSVPTTAGIVVPVAGVTALGESSESTGSDRSRSLRSFPGSFQLDRTPAPTLQGPLQGSNPGRKLRAITT